MRHTWIIDVLDDLRTFAVQNDLPDLAQQLEVAAHIAQESETSVVAGATTRAQINDIRSGRVSA